MNKETIKDALRGAGLALAVIVWIVSVMFLIVISAEAVNIAASEGDYGPAIATLGTIGISVIVGGAWIAVTDGIDRRKREARDAERRAELDRRMASITERTEELLKDSTF